MANLLLRLPENRNAATQCLPTLRNDIVLFAGPGRFSRVYFEGIVKAILYFLPFSMRDVVTGAVMSIFSMDTTRSVTGTVISIRTPEVLPPKI